jgi:hypothetical protein
MVTTVLLPDPRCSSNAVFVKVSPKLVPTTFGPPIMRPCL